MSAQVIAVANQKGGVGKTTSVWALGSIIAEAGSRVLMVDLDSQANLTSTVGQEPNSVFYTMLSDYALHDRTDSELKPVRQIEDNWYLLAGHINMSLLEIDIAKSEMAGDFVVRDVLAPIAADFDVVLLDCPPSLSKVTTNALATADQVLIPVETEHLALEGLVHITDTIDKVRRRLNRKLTYAGILPTKVRASTKHHADMWGNIRQLCEIRQIPLLPYIPLTVYVGEAIAKSIPLTRYPDAHEATKAYRETAEMLWRAVR